MNNNQDKWRVWDSNEDYGQVLYKRATGDLPEMESSKKMAQELSKVIRDGDRVLDVGCGAGHYLKSFRREIGDKFFYTGADATKNYIDLARTAFSEDKNCEFVLSDIFNLDIPDKSYDIVMCNNVLLHLPSIKKPLSELVRVAKRTVFVRFLCGERSFRIKDVHPDGEDYADNGEPLAFHFYNIYSKSYVNKLISEMKGIKEWTITPDFDFEKKNIVESIKDHNSSFCASNIIGDYQVNGYILQPWAVLEITLL